MARQADKTKYNEKPTDGYQAPPVDYGARQKYEAPPPDYPPTAPAVRQAAVQAVVFSTEEGEALNADSQRLANVEVTLASADDYGPRFQDIKTTNADGRVGWSLLPARRYTLTATPPVGFSESDSVEVDLTQGDQEVPLGLEPQPAILRLLAFNDAQCCCDPAGQDPLEKISFEIRRRHLSLGRFETVNGQAEVAVKKFGQLRVYPQAQAQFRGRKLSLPFPGAINFQAVPGGQNEMQLPYQPSQGELEVSALFVEGEDNAKTVPIQGAIVQVYAGPLVQGQPLREHQAPYVFSDLPPGLYTLAAFLKSFRGDAVEPLDPEGGVMSITLEAGNPFAAVFRFGRAHGKVVGYVFAENTLEPLEDVSLTLAPVGEGVPRETRTREGGAFAFNGLGSGLYELFFTHTKFLSGGLQWVLPKCAKRTVPVSVVAGLTTVLKPILAAEDQHNLKVHIKTPDGKPVPYAQFQIYDETAALFGTFGTDQLGEKNVRLPKAGRWGVRASITETGLPIRADAFVQVNEDAEVTALVPGDSRTIQPFTPPFPPNPPEAVIDIPYPLLTEGITAPSAWPSAGAPATADLGKAVDSVLYDVLRWRPSGYKGDAKGFVDALNQSFDLKQIEGHTEFTWTPRSYSVQTGLGAVTGAQASIYTRAKAAVDESLPLLAGLYPLLPEADPQNVTAIRAIVRAGLTELVNELGIEGGPRVLRVDDLFQQLTGILGAPVNPDPERVGGQLGQLASTFGLQRNRVNTIEEEQNLTNFLILADYVLGLQMSWNTQKRFFTRGSGSEPFLGTQLVLVERSLAVVAESVQEVYLAMDSVFLGREERQVVELQFENEPSLFVSELLGWIDQVASNEGPQLIKEGGKQGVVSFQPTIDRLAGLAGEALIEHQNAATLPAGYRTARVQRALQELAEHLRETANLVRQISQRAA